MDWTIIIHKTTGSKGQEQSRQATETLQNAHKYSNPHQTKYFKYEKKR